MRTPEEKRLARNEASKRYRARNRERLLAYYREYYERNRERLIEDRRRYYRDHRDEMRAYQAAYKRAQRSGKRAPTKRGQIFTKDRALVIKVAQNWNVSMTEAQQMIETGRFPS